jgi:hypothetical protein
LEIKRRRIFREERTQHRALVKNQNKVAMQIEVSPKGGADLNNELSDADANEACMMSGSSVICQPPTPAPILPSRKMNDAKC